MTITQQMLQSKKFRAMIAGLVATGAVAISTKFGLDEKLVTELLMAIVGLIGTYILGQGLADQGKGAPLAPAVEAVVGAVSSSRRSIEADILEQIKQALKEGRYVGIDDAGSIIIDG